MPHTKPDSFRRARKISDLACVLIFSIGVMLPLAGFIMDWHPVAPPLRPVQRSGTPLPALTPLQTFSQRFETYFDRHLGFRERLVRWNNAITVIWLRTDPATRIRDDEEVRDPAGRLDPGRVMMGRDGSLFYTPRFTERSFRGLDPMGARDRRLWKKHFVRRRDMLAARGVDYLLVIVPEKHRVLTEVLPPILELRVGPSRTDEILDLLARETSVDVLDLRPRMHKLHIESKYPIYHRTGTHWNEFGAFLAYREVLQHLQQKYSALAPWPIERFDVQYRWGASRGLPVLLRIHGLVEDEYVDLTPLEPRVARNEGTVGARRWFKSDSANQGDWTGGTTRRSTGHKELPRAAFLHDSFLATYMEPFLSEHFEEVSYHWQVNPPLEELLAGDPDIVIELRVSTPFDKDIPRPDGSLTARAKD